MFSLSAVIFIGEEWDRADLGGHRERDKQLFAFEAALLIADELRAARADI